MAKLYPPVIENTVSACYEENGIVKFTIPFSMNRAVSPIQVGGFELKIKTVQTGTVLYTLHTINPSNYYMDETKSYVIFQLKDIEKKLKIGQFYKIQLAYIDLKDANKKNQLYNNYVSGLITQDEYESQALMIGSTGYFSSIGIIKYTTKPVIYINNFMKNALNDYSHTFMGYYDQTGGDISEKIYSYCFNIYDTNGKDIIYTSGECLHNSSSDTNTSISFDVFDVPSDIQYYKTYYIDYTVTTINKLVLSSPKYRIIQRETIDPEFYGSITAVNKFDNGYIELQVIPDYDYYVKRALELCVDIGNSWLDSINTIMEKGFSIEQAETLNYYHSKGELSKVSNIKTTYPCTGSYVIARADAESNYSNWEIIYKFKLFNKVPKGILYEDFYITQGKKYKYSLQQYNDNGLYSKRLYSNDVIADFEDAFLIDGERQLKIKYNPKVSKFTNTVLESKQETIGGQYPFIFRNGQVNYNEFQISGLISYLMDDLHLFLPKSQLLTDEKTINYTTENIAQERIFKMEVLKWLNNGKPKMFKSPTEGNFLIRLMKVSLTPEEKLGRMLHSFSCSAYEIGKCDNQHLQDCGILVLEAENKPFIKFFTIDLSEKMPGIPINVINNSSINVTSVKCENMFFGDEIILTYQNGKQETFQIGVTGTYNIENVSSISTVVVKPRFRKADNVEESKFSSTYFNYYVKKSNGQFEPASSTYYKYIDYYVIANQPLQGMMTFTYIGEQPNTFLNIQNVHYLNPTFKQFIGAHDILREIQYLNNNIPDNKKRLVNWYYITAKKRPIDQVIREHKNNNNIYYYGLDEYSEKLKFTEIRYPIGLRAYEPNKYYKKLSTGEFKLADSPVFEEIKENNITIGYETYYLYGTYVLCDQPVGKLIYEKNKYYIYDSNKNEYELSTEEFDQNKRYYAKYFDKKNIPYYEEVLYLTLNKDYIYAPGKFYRKTDKRKDGLETYTLANSFISDREKNRNYYYMLIPPEGEQNMTDASLYQNAYVTINDKYVYESQQYYMQVTTSNNLVDDDGNAIPPTKQYMLCNSGDFNIHNITVDKNVFVDNIETSYSVEFEPFNGDVIKYYKVKPILPEILHQIGENSSDSGWIAIQSQDPTGANPLTGTISGYPLEDTVINYKFQPAVDENGQQLFIDFYNNETIYNSYEPWIKINGEIYDINDTITFTATNLSDFESIYELISGNGVVVEVGYQIQFIDYNIESSSAEGYRKAYDRAVQELNNKLTALLDKTHPDYINLDDEPTEENISIYNNYYYNYYQKQVSTSYTNLVNRINSILNL